MNKYRQQALNTLIEHYGCQNEEDLRKCFLTNTESLEMILESFEKFGEELELSKTIEFVGLFKIENDNHWKELETMLSHLKERYTKEQVKSFLKQQRELSVMKAIIYNCDCRNAELDSDSILDNEIEIL